MLMIYNPLNALNIGVQSSRLLKSPETWNSKAQAAQK